MTEFRPGRPSAARIARIGEELDAFVADLQGLRSAVVASVDGFALAEARGQDGSGERLAAMTSSMLALAKAVSRELALGELDTLTLESGDGKVLMLSIPAPGSPLLLMAACSRGAVMGRALWSARQCSRRIVRACVEVP